MTIEKSAEPSPVATAIGDALGFTGAILAVPIAILIVGTPIVLFARLVIWLVGRAFGA